PLQRPRLRFWLAVAFGASNLHSTKQKASSKPSSATLAEQNRIPHTNASLRKRLAIANRLKSHTIRQKSPTINCSIFTGGKSIRPRRMASSPILGRVIAPQSSTAIMRKKRLPKHQRRNLRARENSTKQSWPKSCPRRNFIPPRRITKNTTSKTRSTLKRSKKDQAAFRSKGKPGATARSPLPWFPANPFR